MEPKIQLKGPSLENTYTPLLSAQSHHVRFKIKEYKQIRYVVWAVAVGRWSKGQKKKLVYSKGHLN